MKKLAIAEEREEDKYDYLTSVKCWKCDPQNGAEIPDASNDPKVRFLFFFLYASRSSFDNKQTHHPTQIDQISYRRYNAIHVFRTSIRSKSMGGRDKPM